MTMEVYQPSAHCMILMYVKELCLFRILYTTFLDSVTSRDTAKVSFSPAAVDSNFRIAKMNSLKKIKIPNEKMPSLG